MSETVQAVQFYVNDLAESLETTDVNKLTKLELAKQIEVWRNSISVARSLLGEVC